MRWRVLAAAVMVWSSAHADVARELRAQAGRLARLHTPPALAPLVDEHVRAGDVQGLPAVIARARRSPMGPAVEAGFRAAAHGAAGDRKQVERHAKQVEAALAHHPDDELRNSARCAVALGFEYLRDAAEADRWRASARGIHAWCDERLPIVAAARGDHARAAALLAGVQHASTRIAVLLELAKVHAGTPRAAPLVAEAAKLAKDERASVQTWSKLAIAWAHAGNRAQARAVARQALAALDKDIATEPLAIGVSGGSVVEALAAAGEQAAVAKLLRRMEAVAKRGGLLARVDVARMTARYGDKRRGKTLVAASAREAAGATIPDHQAAAVRHALVDAYLALGDVASAIDHTTYEIESILVVARHCREQRCARTPAVAAALERLAAKLQAISK